MTHASLTPLMRACALGRCDAAERLLAAGADPNALEPRMGASALHLAAQSGRREAAALLLDHGAFIDLQSPVIGHTALMDAVACKHAPMVELLLARGARTTPRNHFQQNALDIARADGLAPIAQLIERRDAHDAALLRQGPPLTLAARSGDAALAARLIAQGAALDARTPRTGTPDDDYTALGLAAREGHAALVRLLLDAGADAGLRNGLMGATAVHEAAYAGHAHVLAPLAAHPALELDAQGVYNGFSALHDAVWHGHLEAARTLLRAGADPASCSHGGLTPRELAAQYGYAAIADLFERRA